MSNVENLTDHIHKNIIKDWIRTKTVDEVAEEFNSALDRGLNQAYEAGYKAAKEKGLKILAEQIMKPVETGYEVRATGNEGAWFGVAFGCAIMILIIYQVVESLILIMS